MIETPVAIIPNIGLVTNFSVMNIIGKILNINIISWYMAYLRYFLWLTIVSISIAKFATIMIIGIDIYVFIY